MPLNRSPPGSPRGWLGAICGALGVLPLVPIAAGIATRASSLPALPGLERNSRDFKLATYAEAGVLLLLVPLAALAFGILIPRWMESRARRGRLSFEWVAAGFAISLLLALRGLRPKYGLLAGLISAIAVCAGVLAFRRSFRVRRFFSRRGRRAASRILLAGSSLDLARRASLRCSGALLADLLSELVLAGVALLVITALTCMATSRRPDRTFARLGNVSWIAIALAAIGISFPSMPPGLLALGLVLPVVAARVWKRDAPSTLAERVAVSVLLAVCAWRIVRPPVFWFDSFEDGHSLAPAETYLRGGRPYLDVVPIHGWGADGGVDAFFFRHLGASLHTFFLRRTIWAASALVLLAWACVIALGSAAWGSLGLLFALSICPEPIDRQMLAFGALLLLCLGARTRRRGTIAAAGVLAGMELLYSLDYGVIVAVGGLAALLLLHPLERVSRARRPTPSRESLLFLGGILVGTFPFLVSLYLDGAFLPFLRVSFVETPRWVEEAWGVPAPDAWKTLLSIKTLGDLASILTSGAAAPLVLLLLLGAAGAVLLLRSATGSLDALDRAGFASLVIAAVAMRVVLGRADAAHLARYGLFAGLPAAWLLMRACRAQRARGLAVFVAGALVLLVLHPVRALETALWHVETAARRGRDEPGATPPRSGGAHIAAAEAARLEAFRRYVDEHLSERETFFDFANQPSLYFIAGRPLPIRYYTVAQYESKSRQDEVISDLEKRQPPLALLPSGPYETLDISNAERAPEVARYLTTHYVVEGEAGGLVIARRKSTIPLKANTP